MPTQAAAFIAASGLDRTPGDPYYHSAFGVPFQLHMVYDSSDPWATAAAPVIQSELQAAGLDTTLLPVAGATQTGKTLAAGFADLAVLPQTFTPVHEPDRGDVHAAARAARGRTAPRTGRATRTASSTSW